ncbi:MAG: hypothetical protein WD021_00145 [Rhodothermales bacterium]
MTHDLGLIYLALTLGADEDLDEAELDAMTSKLEQWQPEGTLPIASILHEVILMYVGSSGEQMLETAIVSLRDQLPKLSRMAVLGDLADLASADGTVVMQEVDFIQQLARDWDVDRDVR